MLKTVCTISNAAYPKQYIVVSGDVFGALVFLFTEEVIDRKKCNVEIGTKV